MTKTLTRHKIADESKKLIQEKSCETTKTQITSKTNETPEKPAS